MHVITAITREPKNFDAFGDFPSAKQLRDSELPAYVSSPYHGHGAFVTVADALQHMHEFCTANHSAEPDTSCEIVFPVAPGIFVYVAAEPVADLFTE